MKNSKSKSKKLTVAIPFDFDPCYGYFLKPEMVRALTSRGVEVLPLLYDISSLEEVLKRVDGVVIPGGLGDLDPQLYGQEKKYENVKIIRERCDFEYRLLEAYLPMEKPLLSICWGLQMVNVFLGGSLIQDIPSERKSEICHEQKEAKHLPTHWIQLANESRAHDLFGADKFFVNSTHHQAIDKLAPGLEAQGHSPDGIVECFVDPAHPYSVGVQWHPERLANDVVIPSFLKACLHSR